MHGHVLGQYEEEGSFNDRPYFSKQNSTATAFMFYSGRIWMVSNVLDKKNPTLRYPHFQIPKFRRDSVTMRMLQKVINRIRVKERSCELLTYGWYYETNIDIWNKDTSLVLDWLSPEPCRRVEEGVLGGKKEAHKWRDILSLEEATRRTKTHIAILLLMVFEWVKWIRSKRIR